MNEFNDDMQHSNSKTSFIRRELCLSNVLCKGRKDL